MNPTKEEIEAAKKIVGNIHYATVDGLLSNDTEWMRQHLIGAVFLGINYQKQKQLADLKMFLEWQRDNIRETTDKYYGWMYINSDYPLLNAEQVVAAFSDYLKTIKP